MAALAGFGRVGRSQGEAGEVLGLHLQQGEIVDGIGGDDPEDREKAPVLGLGEDVFGASDDVVVGYEESVRGDEKSGAGSLDLAVLILDREKVDGGASLFGEGTQIGNFGGGQGPCSQQDRSQPGPEPQEHLSN
ncbi:MAG: hypothetical protein RL549_240 [Verrucomicrobiota bacterium]